MADGALLLGSAAHLDPIPQAGLVPLMRALGGGIRLAVLNACNSFSCARALTEVIDCAIGYDGEVSDAAAIAFSESFYRAIAFGKSVENAFKQAVAAVALRPKSSDAEGEPVPQLACRAGVNPDQVCFVKHG